MPVSRHAFVAPFALALALPTGVMAQRRAAPAPAPAPAAMAGAAYDTSLFRALTWRSIGPFRGGRVTAATGVVGQPYVYYMGATGGGVWKTTDGGMTWLPVSDAFFGAGSIGAIEVAASDPNVVFVGTGESPIRGNVSPGDGMYKSTDAGRTWSHAGLRNAGQIGAIRVHPANPDLVYVAVLGHAFGPNSERGVFRSRDGGTTWEKILFRSDSAGAIDLAMDPANPRILYTAFWQAVRRPWTMESGGPGSGLFKSTDGGDTWTEITRNPGLPRGVIGKIGVTVSHVNHDRVWAIVEADSGGVFRSEDGGATWTRLNEDRRLRQRAWYYSHIHADPQDNETVYVLNTGFYRSVDGGRTYTTIATPHGDNHALWIDPHDNRRMINGNDGGANVTYNGGVTWTGQDNQPTAQFYHVTATNDFPYQVCGAQQDNSTLCTATRTTGNGIGRANWYTVGGCESGYIAVRPDDTNISYAGCYGGYLERHDRRTGQERNIMVWPDNPMGWGAADLRYRFQWTFPIVLAPNDPNTMYVGGNLVFRTTNEGQSWTAISPDLTRNDPTKGQPSGGPITKDNTSVEYYGTVFTIAPSPRDAGVIWAGSDDGRVHVTRDAGTSWQEVTPPDLPAWAMISLIEASPHDPGTAYVAATRYKLDDFTPYIFRTSDYGRTWRRITGGIPASHFIRVVREDPARRGLLYAGGEFGVYVSFDYGTGWQSLRRNLPVVPIHDLVVTHNDLVAATHGRSFWVLDDLTPLHQLADSVARADAFLFGPRDVYRIEGGRGDTLRAGRNPPSGAVIHYSLRTRPDSAVQLEILDSDGTVIKTWSSRSRDSTARIDSMPGTNRFVWNMRYPDASTFPNLIMWGGGVQGPMAPPGRYQVRLTIGGWTETRPFNLLKDPRGSATQPDLVAQFTLLIRIRDRLSAANDAVTSIRDLKEQLDGVSQRSGALSDSAAMRSIRARADSLRRRLSTVEEAIYQVRNRSSQDPLNYPIRLNNKLAALGSVVASGDARPTDQSYAVFEDLSAQLQAQLDRLRAIVETDVPAFNALVRERDVPALIVRTSQRGTNR
ncbi:MAG: glycosyl hydrolase [Gemmatimonadales bacterium]|nr:glycosyl hydrolase [Gemmatimonadales bacterium]